MNVTAVDAAAALARLRAVPQMTADGRRRYLADLAPVEARLAQIEALLKDAHERGAW